MPQLKIKKIISNILSEKNIISDRSLLDPLLTPKTILGREEESEKILRYLLTYKQNYVAPMISIYGRSGSGKSSITKYICENLPDTVTCYVNLRKSKTVFGAVNLILTELGEESVQNNVGLTKSFQNIFNSIDSKLNEDTKTFFLILDEIDVIFEDTRGNPSDFLLKIVEFSSEMRKKGKILSILAISNNILQNYNIDDRLRSRIGTSEIFFPPYSHDDIVEILNHIAKRAFSVTVDSAVVEKCAKLSSAEHGDMRRAIDLLRKSAEIASSKSEDLSVKHVLSSDRQLSTDIAGQFLKTTSHHTRYLCIFIAMASFVTEKKWHPVSSIYKIYQTQLRKNKEKPLSYRRISELLKEIEQSGIILSDTRSNGRYGYQTKIQLQISPESVGATYPLSFQQWKTLREKYYEFQNNPDLKYPKDDRQKFDRYEAEKFWNEFLGLL